MPAGYAARYTASLDIIHRDVKPANILCVVREGRLRKALLADFGEAKQLQSSITAAAASIAARARPPRAPLPSDQGASTSAMQAPLVRRWRACARSGVRTRRRWFSAL